MPMKKSILHIELVYRPLARNSQRQNCPDGSGLHNRAGSFIIVNARALSKATKNPARLVALERTICLEFVLEDPLASHHIGSRWAWYKIPSVVGKQC